MIGTRSTSQICKSKLIHRVIKNVQPDGWENQIPDYPVVNHNLYYEALTQSPLSPIPQIESGSATFRLGTLLNTWHRWGLISSFPSEKGNYFPNLL